MFPFSPITLIKNDVTQSVTHFANHTLNVAKYGFAHIFIANRFTIFPLNHTAFQLAFWMTSYLIQTTIYKHFLSIDRQLTTKEKNSFLLEKASEVYVRGCEKSNKVVKQIDYLFSKIFWIRGKDEINPGNVASASYLEICRYRVGSVVKGLFISVIGYNVTNFIFRAITLSNTRYLLTISFIAKIALTNLLISTGLFKINCLILKTIDSELKDIDQQLNTLNTLIYTHRHFKNTALSVPEALAYAEIERGKLLEDKTFFNRMKDRYHFIGSLFYDGYIHKPLS